ncbi:hypothetical protein OH492_15260 [Vibrio chagasii]|nr:hypothetical protein [Vibrio chagasii]
MLLRFLITLPAYIFMKKTSYCFEARMHDNHIGRCSMSYPNEGRHGSKGVQHDTQMTNITRYQLAVLDQSLSERLPRGVMIFDITAALMRVLIERMAFGHS